MDVEGSQASPDLTLENLHKVMSDKVPKNGAGGLAAPRAPRQPTKGAWKQRPANRWWHAQTALAWNKGSKATRGSNKGSGKGKGKGKNGKGKGEWKKEGKGLQKGGNFGGKKGF